MGSKLVAQHSTLDALKDLPATRVYKSIYGLIQYPQQGALIHIQHSNIPYLGTLALSSTKRNGFSKLKRTQAGKLQ